MSRVALKQLIGRPNDARAVLTAITDALGLPHAVEDHEGRLLHGAPLAEAGGRFPVTLDGRDLGWVSGSESARVVAALLDHLVSEHAEKKALGAEVLHLYREVNLIYSFSEKIAALLDLDRVARLTLHEARHLIGATDGVIMLLDEGGSLTTLAGFGDDLPHLSGVRSGHGVIGTVAATGIAEIVNDVHADPRRIGDDPGVRSLLCAPLKVGERVIGIIAMANAELVAYTAGELKLLTTLGLQTATAIENARLFERTVQAAAERERLLALHRETEVARARLERELELAARIQADLFPAELPGLAGYDLAARNRPARQCGGDYYDALRVPGSGGEASERVLLCVADVAGKGLPASLLMSSIQATLRALVGRTPSLGDLAERASDLLFSSTGDSKYATAALVDLDPTTGDARYVSAGHVDSLLIRAGGDAVHLGSTATPLGLLPPGLPFGETGIVVQPGDCLVLYSDGVPDAQNEAGEDFGEERLADILRASALEPAEAIVGRVFDAIDSFAGAAEQYDDITVMILRRSG